MKIPVVFGRLRTVFAAMALSAGALNPAKAVAQQAVAQFGPWTLYEGPASSDGNYVCGISLGGVVRGQTSRVNIGVHRGEKILYVTIREGRYQKGAADPIVMTLQFSSGVTATASGFRDLSVATSKLDDADKWIREAMAASSVVISAPGFFPLTVDLDQVADGIEAMKRCQDGETIAPPRAPLR